MKGGAQLEMFNPFNVITYLSFFSPIILVTFFVGTSFVFQNFKGFIYLGFLLGCCFLRELTYYLSKASPVVSDNSICTDIQYSKYGNSSFSTFVIAFTIMYISIPMFTNGAVNPWVFAGLLGYFFLDFFIKTLKCGVKISDIFVNTLSASALAFSIVFAMNAGGSGKYLMFNEVSTSSKEICSVAKNQTFKCAVYKNGEVIANL